MTPIRDDSGEGLLREEFRTLRGEVERSGGVPDFAAMMARARAEAATGPEVLEGRAARRPPRVRRIAQVGWASAALAAGVAAVLLTIRGSGPSDADFERVVASYAANATAGAWRSPTSSLLDVPGIDLTRTMPAIGTPLRGLDTSQVPSLEEGRS